ncbi:hypothetical protein RCO48_19730 [Peribacillus frigoritolerans]|nr:hypothetical protein [Peribacillus frigoritolerans]
MMEPVRPFKVPLRFEVRHEEPSGVILLVVPEGYGACRSGWRLWHMDAAAAVT